MGLRTLLEWIKFEYSAKPRCPSGLFLRRSAILYRYSGTHATYTDIYKVLYPCNNDGFKFTSQDFFISYSRGSIFPGHGAMSGTNFKKNQKSKTRSLVHYKFCCLKGCLSLMERLHLGYYFMPRSPVQFLEAALSFFQKIYAVTSSYSSIYIFIHQKSYTTI